MDMIGHQNGARLYIRVLYISEDDDGLIDLLMELYTLSNYVPLGPSLLLRAAQFATPQGDLGRDSLVVLMLSLAIHKHHYTLSFSPSSNSNSGWQHRYKWKRNITVACSLSTYKTLK